MKAEVTRTHKSHNGALLETSPACVYTRAPGTHTRQPDTLTQSAPPYLPGSRMSSLGLCGPRLPSSLGQTRRMRIGVWSPEPQTRMSPCAAV